MNRDPRNADLVSFIIRTIFWLVAVIFLVRGEKSASPSIHGLVLGMVAGDMITWIAAVIIVDLPRSLIAPSLDLAVNILIVYLVVNVWGLDFPKDMDGQACAFVGLMGTLGIKSFYYTISYFTDDDL